MKNESINQTSETKKADDTRRTELAMMYLLLDKYPHHAIERIRQFPSQSREQRKTANP